MGCSGCGSGGVLPGSISAQRRSLERQQRPKVKGHSSSGIVKSQKRLLRESGKATESKKE